MFVVCKGVNGIRPYGSLVSHKDTKMYARQHQARKTKMPGLDENISRKALINVLGIWRKDK